MDHDPNPKPLDQNTKALDTIAEVSPALLDTQSVNVWGFEEYAFPICLV